MSECLCLFVLSKLWMNGLEVANTTLCVSNFCPSSQARVTLEKSSSPFRLTRLVFKFSWKSFHWRRSISDIISMENHLAQYQTRKTKSKKGPRVFYSPSSSRCGGLSLSLRHLRWPTFVLFCVLPLPSRSTHCQWTRIMSWELYSLKCGVFTELYHLTIWNIQKGCHRYIISKYFWTLPKSGDLPVNMVLVFLSPKLVLISIDL